MLDEIVEKQDTVALLGAEARKPAPCGAILRIREDVGRAVNEDEPGSNRDLDRPLRLALILRCDPRLDRGEPRRVAFSSFEARLRRAP